MSVNPNTNLVLNGVGSGMLYGTDGSVTTIDKGQNMTFEITVSEEKVYGGDSLFPFFTFIKEKGGRVSIDNAVFNLTQMKMSQNATLDTTTAKKHFAEDVTVNASSSGATVVTTSGIDYATVVLFNKATGVALTNKLTATPTGATEFKITAAGAITFGSSVTGTFVVDGYATDTNSASATIVSDAVPGANELRWNLKTQDEAGNAYMVSLRAKKVKCSGKFNMDFKRGTASVQKLEFEILDPADGSKEFCQVIVTDL